MASGRADRDRRASGQVLRVSIGFRRFGNHVRRFLEECIGVTRPAPSPDALAQLAPELEALGASEVVRWAAQTYGTGLTFTASFEDPVLVHIVATTAPQTEVVLLDTQYHFAETLWYAEELRKRYDFTLRVVCPAPTVQPDNLWQSDVEACCGVRKVMPLAGVLLGKDAWITGIRRADAPTRANAQVVAFDAARNIVKVNPLVAWTDEQMDAFIDEQQLPRHPLAERGYASIGCWPCTRPVAPGEDRRAGRWAGQGKVECGLHATELGS